MARGHFLLAPSPRSVRRTASKDHGDPWKRRGPAGLVVEDVIVEIDGIPVREAGDVQRLMTEQRIGKRVEVRFVRGGQARSVAVVPEELPTR